MTKLTEKQKRFAEYYIESGNGSEAARKAGYKGKNLNNVASENLAKLGIKNYIDERLKKLEEERVMSANEVMKLLTSIARGETEEEVIVVEGQGDGVSEGRIMKKRVSEKERLKALELIGKRYRLYTDKVQVDGVIPVMITGDDEIED